MTTVDQVIAVAQTELGKPYVYGAEGPNSFDCSGLMQYVFSHVGISLPRTSEEQQRATTPVKNPLPGDLVFWGNPAYHVALYIGGGKVIAAPHTGANVQIESVWGSPTYGRVKGLGAAAAPVVATLTAATTVGNSIVSSILGPARDIVVQVAFVGLGAALVGAGLWKGTRPLSRLSGMVGL